MKPLPDLNAPFTAQKVARAAARRGPAARWLSVFRRKGRSSRQRVILSLWETKFYQTGSERGILNVVQISYVSQYYYR